MTLDEAYARFRDALTTRNYTATTRDHYRRDIGWFLDWLGAGAGLREVTTVTRAEIERSARLADRARPQPLALQTQSHGDPGGEALVRVAGEDGAFSSRARRGGSSRRRRGSRSLPAVLTVAEVEKLLQHPTPRRLAASGTVRCSRCSMRRGCAAVSSWDSTSPTSISIVVWCGCARGRAEGQHGADDAGGQALGQGLRERGGLATTGCAAPRGGVLAQPVRGTALGHNGARPHARGRAKPSGITKKAHVHALRHACAARTCSRAAPTS